MVPYYGCQQYGCWINRFFCTNDIPLPKFSIGQRIFVEYPSEDETAIERHPGTVIGLLYKAPGLSRRTYIPGWYCLIRWDDDEITRSLLVHVEVPEIEVSADSR